MKPYLKKTNKFCFFLLFLCLSFCFLNTEAQENKIDSALIIPELLPIDEITVVGYATGSNKMISGSVDKIRENQMNKGIIVNPLDALRGKVAGVNISPANNGPGALSFVRIRGTTSLTGGNDPLVIIDGVFGNLSLLNAIFPADIESFTILKDASETAQYGSRGASGVIEVTTKKGKDGKFTISYKNNFGIETVYRNMEMLSADNFRNLAKQKNIEILDLGANTNFAEEMVRTGFIQNHHISFGGGTESSNYRASLGFIDRKGVIPGNNSRNFTSKLNICQRAFDNYLLLEMGAFGSLMDNQYLNDFQKAFYSAATFNPTFPNHKNKETGNWDGIANASQITHPLAWLDVDDDEANAHINTHLRFEVFLSDNLKLKAFGSYTYNVIENSHYFPTTVWGGGEAYRGLKKHESLMGNIILSYKKHMQKHQLDALGMAEAQKDTYSGFHTTVTNFKTNQFGYNNLQAGSVRLWEGTGSYYESIQLMSFLGRINYMFNERYVATINTRLDGSSKIGINNKWGFFPSASLAWHITKEEFMKNLTFLNELKLRAGYGWSGNQDAIDSYTSMQLLKPNGVVPVNGVSAVTMGIIRNANHDLRWEVKETFNAGIDAGLLNNRIIFKGEFYRSITNNLLYLYNVSVPPFAYNSLLANLGSMKNKGIELSLGLTPVQSSEMELNLNFNASFQTNKLISLSGMYQGEQMDAPRYTSISELNGAGFHGGYNRIVYQIEGQPLGVFYLPKSTGLSPSSSGDGFTYGIADLNGNGISLEDGEDRYIAGQAVPKALLSSNISFRYKQFDIVLQVNGAFGHKIYNGTALTYMNMNIFPDYNVMKDAPKKNIQDQTATDYWLEKGDYLNFDYLTIGWNVPLGKAKKYIQELRISCSVNNLATITSYSGLSPMINSYVVDNTLGTDDKRNYPVYRTCSFGLSINF